MKGTDDCRPTQKAQTRISEEVKRIGGVLGWPPRTENNSKQKIELNYDDGLPVPSALYRARPAYRQLSTNEIG